ncbi:MAG TPA: hypothetical protein VEZ47_10835 [Gemmatirosa sp.]|nr:hypothetical protein [Gemmatirosa sp.]
MRTSTRVACITLGLVAAGGVLGALAAALAAVLGFGVFAALIGRQLLDPAAALFVGGVAARIGAALGIVVGPLAAWLLLREVPLGRALLGTTLGALIGGLLGLPAALLGDAGAGSAALLLGLPVLGAVAAAWSLRHAPPRA